MTAARTPEKPRIDLGKMGMPICERLTAHEFEVTALAPNADSHERAGRAGLRSEGTLRSVLEGARFVVSAISDDSALLDVVFKAGGLKETLNATQTLLRSARRPRTRPDASPR